MKQHIKKIISVFLMAAPLPAFAGREKADISQTLFHHILNGRDITLFPGLQPITLPFGMSVHEFMLIFSVLLIAGFSLAAVKKGILKPKVPAVIIEILVLFVRDDIVNPVMGEERGEKWLPFFLTQFIFLFTVNLVGLIPAFKTATGNINVTSAMALMVFLLIFIIGIKNLGLIGFFKNLFPRGTNIPVGIFVAFLEFLGLFTRSIVLSLRLFANMFAGHLAILSFLVLIFVINPFFGFISLPFALFTYTLEVLIALIQAFVFTLLSCIYISMASTPEGE